jgi:general stress protein 26
MRTDNASPSDRELMARAISVVNHVGIGMMCTLDGDGAPHARWMTTIAQNGVRSIITLSALHTRKIAELESDPRVCWVFTADDFADVVTLHGSVTVHRNALAGMQAWDRLSRAAQTYAFGSIRTSEDPQIVTLDTTVERVELISPSLEIYAPRDLGKP